MRSTNRLYDVIRSIEDFHYSGRHAGPVLSIRTAKYSLDYDYGLAQLRIVFTDETDDIIDYPTPHNWEPI